jgi:protein-disulfide isomerase
MTQLIPAVNNKDHVYGHSSALIELVKYGDYECPYCGAAYHVVKEIQAKLQGKLKFVFRDFPLTKIHPNAFLAAAATEAAALQSKFWEMHDILFENQKTLSVDNIFLFADNIGLNITEFQSDLQQNSTSEKVNRDFLSGLRSGVNKTPTFYVNGERYNGDWKHGELLSFLLDEINNKPGIVEEGERNNHHFEKY